MYACRAGIKDEVVEYRQRQAEAAAVVMAKDAEILKKLEAAGYTPGGGGGAAGDGAAPLLANFGWKPKFFSSPVLQRGKYRRFLSSNRR